MAMSLAEEGPWGQLDIFHEPTDPEMVEHLGRKRESFQNQVCCIRLHLHPSRIVCMAAAVIEYVWRCTALPHFACLASSLQSSTLGRQKGSHRSTATPSPQQFGRGLSEEIDCSLHDTIYASILLQGCKRRTHCYDASCDATLTSQHLRKTHKTPESRNHVARHHKLQQRSCKMQLQLQSAPGATPS